MLMMVMAAVLAGRVVPALAEGDDKVHGFVTYGVGEVSGRVVDDDGKPIANAEVHVVAGAAVERIMKTDGAGKFKASVSAGGTSWFFVRGRARISGPSILSSEGDGELIEIHEVIPPAVMPRPLSSPRAIPDYTDEAIEHNTWTRAWLMVDVDETGSVRQLKLLQRPGFGLDAIAIRKGFELRFEPALDRAKKPTSALAIWIFEWPPYYWLLEKSGQGDNAMTRMPLDARGIPCRGSGPTHSIYRDCSRPELSKAMTQPWVERPNKK
jgi:hypothetical protein